jgi:hypothetical protein
MSTLLALFLTQLLAAPVPLSVVGPMAVGPARGAGQVSVNIPVPVAGSDDVWRVWSLDNGIRVTSLHAPLASQQIVFTMLPMGLLTDDAQRTQFSHLTEHLMVRSTDPEGVEADGIVFNGETTALVLRLETMAPPERWMEGLTRQVKWLSTRAVEVDLLEREKQNIALEEANTASGGHTHKWALAAWNQVLRHGLLDVKLHGDIASATVKQASAALMDVRVGERVHVVSIGPLPVDEVRAGLEQTFGTLPGEAWVAPVPSLPPDAIREVGQHIARWDLPARHYLEWYPVPDDSALDRIKADALAQLFNRKLQQRGLLRSLGVQAMAAADLISPEGRWLLLSASLPTGVDPVVVSDEWAEVTHSLSGQEARIVVQDLGRQLTELPDFEVLRKQYASNPGGEWIEAQQAMFLMYAQLNMGLSREELIATYPSLEAGDLVTFGQTVLREDQRSSLLLEP